MVKCHVTWLPVLAKNVRGSDIAVCPMQIIESYSRGRLLPQILEMKKNHPVSLEHAISMMLEKLDLAYDQKRIDHSPGGYHWYFQNFVEWISSEGYHIELTGDEFEACENLLDQ